MKKIIVIVLAIIHYTKYIILLSAFLYSVFYFFDFDVGKINDNEFLFQFIGILLGFAITIFQFIISMVEKIKENHKLEVNGDVDKVSRFQTKVDKLYKELRENIKFVFVSLIIISILFVPMNIPYRIEKSIHVAIFLLNLYAIFDLVAVSFSVSNTTALIKDDDNR